MKSTVQLMLSLLVISLAACDRKPALPAAAPSAPPAPAPTTKPPAAPTSPLPAPGSGAAPTGTPASTGAVATTGAATPAGAAAPTPKVSALGLSFTIPEGWRSAPPSNPMRLAELTVPHASGDAAKNCLVVFSSAGGDVQANIDRWAGQVLDAAGRPSNPTVTQREVAGMPAHIAEMTGAFSPGMSDTNTYSNWTLRGAIIETPRGLLFIKMTGPADAMGANAGAFNVMIDSLKP